MAAILVARARTPRLWLHARTHFNVALSLAALEMETMPYPSTHPDPSVFESISDEYSSVATAKTATGSTRSHFTPLTSSETLASLVLKRDFRTAESLRKEMTAHDIPIPHDARYLHAALHAIAPHRQNNPAQTQERIDAFVAWLSLAPDRQQEWLSFSDIRHKLFRSMDHLNLTLVYRFGLVLASKGYHSGDAAMQVVSTLARYARPSVVERYLQQVEDTSRDYDSEKGIDPPSDFLVGAYSLAIRTLALGGKNEAALTLTSTARSRGIHIPDFTLNMVAKHAPDRQTAMDRIRAVYPSWNMQDTTNHPVSTEVIATEHADDIAALAARLRTLRAAMRSPTPPSPHALHSFITSYQALGRTHALPLLRSLAYRYSPKSASTWAFTEMLHHRSRREFVHILFVFAHHFHLVGVPRKTLLSIVRGPRGKQARKEQGRPWRLSPLVPQAMNGKLWPSAYHTALVWDAILALSNRDEQDRLYALLLSLVRRSRQVGWDEGTDPDQAGAGTRVRVQIPVDAFDAAHFSPFVSSWSRPGRGRARGPAEAARVLRDMMELGVKPTLVQWSMVARGYAQHGDADVALRILDRMEEAERGSVDGAEMEMKSGLGSETGTESLSGKAAVTEMGRDRDKERGNDDEAATAAEHKWTASDALLGLHTNVLRGFVVTGDVEHAREVERRLVERLGYRSGERAATDVGVGMLRELEGRVWARDQYPCPSESQSQSRFLGSESF